jgi:malonyl-CoA O-methyltransferase
LTLAVVGTGTEVGKTVVSAVLLARYVAELPLAYWKPVATGELGSERDAAVVRRLAGPGPQIVPEAYLFTDPLSPHLAARLTGAVIDPAKLAADLARLRAVAGRGLVVEGVGGVLVPLSEPSERGPGVLLADWLAAAALPCLVVALSTLGTINHTLLTLEALRARRIAVAGVVLNGPPNLENRRAIERFGDIEVVAELPPLAPLDPAAVARAARDFDPTGRLAPHLAPEVA